MAHDARTPVSDRALLPLGALLLGACAGAMAQATGPATSPTETRTLSTVTVKEKADAPEGKTSLRTTTTRIGRGTQELRDVPQSITVVTERLMDDRNLDTLKDALRNTAGITFLAAEGGEEDIRLRSFSLATTGDLFLDGMRDPAFYDRDTFNNDRVEVLRGSASMLFGRGSTGGAVNQVSKQPRAMNEHEVTATVGSHQYRRITGDFNLRTGEESGLRLNVMKTRADNNGAGSSIDKQGLAAAWRWGIGTRDEFLASLYWLDNDNGINYGLPWIRPTASSASDTNGMLPGLDPANYYGMSSDYNHGAAKMVTLAHTHRFDGNSELRTQIRKGAFERDQRAGTVRLTAGTDLRNFGAATVFTRGTQLKIQDVDTLHAQTDFSTQLQGMGLRHELQAGLDYAQEQKTVYLARSAAQGGVTLAKPTTTAGTPDDGAWIDESTRVLRTGNQFTSRAWGAYAQDLVQIAPAWKLLGGLRYDNMSGAYDQFAIPTNAAGPTTATAYAQDISVWSKRVGLLWQPNALHAYHLSWGSSFNTSGDAYSYNALSANTPPESSENIELGARLDSQDKRFTTRLALFRSTKKNERNTDPDTAATRLLLSGRRHTAGVEIDVSGRITPRWEVFGSYMWMPIARVDEAASTATTAGNRAGDRPGLSPRHSGTVWSTYQFNAQWRAGAGVTFRSRQSPADTTPPTWEVPGFATVDLMAEYRVNDSVTVKANISNLANKYYGEALYRGHYIPGTGRNVQLALTTRF
ncbi:MAG: TonB-dependent siderophore receptor [Pseudomonadota bacterium]